jgi:phage-related minor tail protein
MAVDIGPKIGIDGEAEFRQQINLLTTQIKTFGSEMQAVTSEFGDNQKSAEALTAKNQVLNKSIDAQSQKLEELKRGLSQSQQLYGENDSKTLKWQQSVNNATTDLNKMKNQVKDNESALGSFGSAVDDIGDSLDNAGNDALNFGDVLNANLASEAITGVISTIKDAVIDLGKELANYSRESEAATTKASAYFGETGAAAEQTQKVIKDVFTGGVGESMDQVAEAVMTVKKNIDNLSETDMKNITDQALTLDSLYGIDMNETLRGVNSLMQQFGLDAQTAMDYIVSGTQNGLDKTSELGDNLAEYSGKFAQAGYSAEEYFQLLNNGLDGGAYNLDKVNDAINEVTTRLADGTMGDAIGSYSQNTQDLFAAWQQGGATQKQVVDSIVSDIQNTTSQQDALNLAATAFGTMAEDGNLKFITSLSSVGDSYTDVTGKANGLFDATTTSQQNMDAAMRQAKESLSPIGDELNDIAVVVIPKAAEAFANFATYISEHGAEIISVIAGIGAGFIVWNIGSILSGVTTALTTMKTAVMGVNAAVAANPIGALVTILAIVITSIITFIATNEDAQAAIGNAWNGIKDGVSDAIEKVKGFLNNVIDFVKENWQALLLLLVNPFAGAFKLLYDNCEGFRETVNNLVINIVTAFTNMKTGIETTVGNIKTAIVDGFNNAIEFIKGLPEQAVDWGKNILKGLVNGITNTVGEVVDAVKGAAGKISGAFKDFFDIHSPSRLMRDQIGKQIVAGVAVGITDNQKEAIKAANGLSSKD